MFWCTVWPAGAHREVVDLGPRCSRRESFLEQIGAILGVGVELDVRLANQAERTPIAWFFNTT